MEMEGGDGGRVEMEGGQRWRWRVEMEVEGGDGGWTKMEVEGGDGVS